MIRFVFRYANPTFEITYMTRPFVLKLIIRPQDIFGLYSTSNNLTRSIQSSQDQLLNSFYCINNIGQNATSYIIYKSYCSGRSRVLHNL